MCFIITLRDESKLLTGGTVCIAGVLDLQTDTTLTMMTVVNHSSFRVFGFTVSVQSIICHERVSRILYGGIANARANFPRNNQSKTLYLTPLAQKVK